MDVTVALVLYADDAALPADSIEDLQLALDIVEAFCNENRLFISVPKTFLTVFHAPSDTGVEYIDGAVYVDGTRAIVKVYGTIVSATDRFKYLGVTLDSTASTRCHLEERGKSFDRSCNLLWAGLSRLPSYPHSFVKFFWQSLVAPVAAYGMEQFHWSEADVAHIIKTEVRAWRRLLRVGGRAPVDAVSVMLRIASCLIQWRSRRLAHFVRLLNSPPDSLQYAALLTFYHLRTQWFLEVIADARLVYPDI